MNFCRRCETQLRNTERHVYTCENGHIIFANASPASCLWILNENNEVLVAVRALEPKIGWLDTPGGFIDEKETSEEAISRELQEEMGLLPNDYTKPTYLLSALDTYEYKGETIDVLTHTYYAKLVGSPTIHPQDDVAKAYFAPLHTIEVDKFCFNSSRLSLLKLQELTK